MKGYNLNGDHTSQLVRTLAKMNFSGNITPLAWYDHLRTDKGKPNLPAILLLSDIVYWYRPIETRDEITARPLPMRKKFAGDFLQRDTKEFAKTYGLTYQQVRDGLNYLQEKGLITKHLRTITMSKRGKRPNTLFVELHPDKLKEITPSDY
jgi:hypothetical protein